jgi:hypothetical protein
MNYRSECAGNMCLSVEESGLCLSPVSRVMQCERPGASRMNARRCCLRVVCINMNARRLGPLQAERRRLQDRPQTVLRAVSTAGS